MVLWFRRKYALDILEKTIPINCKPVDTPMGSNSELLLDHEEPYLDPGRYRRLVGKFNYHITRLDISFVVSMASQFMQWLEFLDILRIKNALGQGLLYEDKGNTHIMGYLDVDWFGSPIDRQYTSGHGIVSLLEVILYPGIGRSRMWSLGQVLRLNIGLWQCLPVSLYG